MPLVDTTTPITSGTCFIPAYKARSDNALLVLVRNAAGDWSLSRTAVAAETYNITLTIEPNLFETTAGKGIRIDSLGISQLITGANLTSNTWTGIQIIQYANNVANSLATYGGTPTVTMPTATQANPYLTAVTFSAAAFMVTTNANLVVDFAVVMQNTGSYRFNGLAVAYSLALY